MPSSPLLSRRCRGAWGRRPQCRVVSGKGWRFAHRLLRRLRILGPGQSRRAAAAPSLRRQQRRAWHLCRSYTNFTSRSACCDTQRWGPSGNIDGWGRLQTLIAAPIAFELCCGTAGLASLSTSELQSRLTFDIPDVDVQAVLPYPSRSCFSRAFFKEQPNVGCVKGTIASLNLSLDDSRRLCAADAECVGFQRTRPGPGVARTDLNHADRLECKTVSGTSMHWRLGFQPLCMAAFLSYTKTGSAFLGTVRHWLAKGLMDLASGGEVLRMRWNRWLAHPAAPSLSPILRRPVTDEIIFSLELPPSVGVPVLAFASEDHPFLHGKTVAQVEIPGFPARSGRTVHFVRDPVRLVGSGTRFWVSSRRERLSDFEHLHALHCRACSPEAWHAIFSRCGYKCSYIDLLQQTLNTSMDDALELEYIRASRMLHQMVDNAVSFANDNTVLQIVPEMLAPQYLSSTLACIVRFLIGSGNPDLGREEDCQGYHPDLPLWKRSWIVNEAAVFNISRSISDSLDYYGLQMGQIRDTHSTVRSKQWVGQDMDTPLRQHPKWGPWMARFKAILDKVLARQKVMYGCPVP